jgi:hypothetical protein
MNNDRLPKQAVTAKMEGVRERGRQRKRWTDEDEEDLKVI